MQLLTPKALRPGDTIGLVAPARWPEPDWMEKMAAWFATHGFKTKIHPQTALRAGRLGGPDAARAGAINDMFGDDSVQAIFCMRGGSGSQRLLDLLDYKLIQKNPKIFCGFSDITALLNAIHLRTGLVTFHGPVGWSFMRDGTDPRTGEDFIKTLAGAPITAPFPAQGLKTGTAEGRLIGGNMSLLAAMIGTPWDWNADDAILFIEDVGEEVYRLDRTLWQLKNAGKFAKLRGVIVGEMTEIADDPPYGKTFEDLLREHLPPNIPLCTNFPCGHGNYLTTLPLGVRARMEIAEKTTQLTLREAAIKK